MAQRCAWGRLGNKTARNSVCKSARGFSVRIAAAAAAAAALALPQWCRADVWDNGAANQRWSVGTNWADNTEPIASDPVNFPAIVPPGNVTILLDPFEFCSTLTFDNSYVLASTVPSPAGSMAISGSNVTVASGQTATIGVQIAGTGGLNKLGPGTLMLNSASGNTFTQNVVVNAGVLSIVSDIQLGVTSGSVTINAGTLAVTSHIGTDRAFTLTNSASSLNVAGFQLQLGKGSVAVNAGSVVTSDTLIALGSSNTSTVSITGTTSTWTATSVLSVGYTGKGQLTLQNGGTISSASAHIGTGAGSTGTATVSGVGSVWTNAGSLGVGYTGSGSLTINSGGVVNTTSLSVAANPGSIGSLTIDGVGSKINAPAAATLIGENGLATLLVTNSGTILSGTSSIGQQSTGNGTATISGIGSTWNCGTSVLTVADSGKGILTVQQGATVVSGEAFIGNTAGSTGTATVTGTGSTWTSSGQISVGRAGKGTLNVLAGGMVSDQFGDIGAAGSAGGSSALVDGVGSWWKTTSSLTIGDFASASLTIQNGGKVTAGQSVLGQFGVTGTALVTGSGSVWTSSSSLIVGQLGGVGSLTIQNAATASSVGGYIGISSGSAAALVTGAGSSWNDTSFLTVGSDGTGTLSITAGGSMNCTTLFLGTSSSSPSTGTITVTDPASLLTINSNVTMAGSQGTATLSILNQGVVSINGNITDAGAGISTLTLDGGTLDMKNHNIGAAPSSIVNVLNFRSGTLKNVAQINGGGVSGGLIKTTAGTLTLDGANNYTGITAVSAGTLIFNTPYNKGSALNIADSAVAQLAHSIVTPNNVVLKIGTLSTSTTGKMDINDNKIILTALPVGTWNGSAYTDVTGLIASGRNGNLVPLWDGSGGIVTTQSNATTGNYHSIGVARASVVRPATTSTTILWGGQTITGTDTLIMYTYGGDATLDGKLNIDDYVKIDQGIAAGLTGWSNGDFNYDGKINVDDYTTIIDSNIGTQGAAFPAGSIAATAPVAVPDPAGGGMALVAALGLLRRRRTQAPG